MSSLRLSPAVRDRLHAIESKRNRGEYSDARADISELVRSLEASPTSQGHDPRPAELIEANLLLARSDDDFGAHEGVERALDRAARIALDAKLNDRAAVALGRRADFLASVGRSPEATASGAQALELLRQSSAASRADRIEVIALVAGVLAGSGDLDAAALLMVECAELVVAVADDPAAARALLAASEAEGRVAMAEGRYDAARTALRRGVALAEMRFGEQSLEVAGVLNSLGVVNKYSGRFDDAETAYRRALEILTRAVGEDQPDMASLLHNLGGVLHARGDFAAAEPYARRAVAIRTRTLGPDDPATILDRAAWASILDALGRSEEAEAILRDAAARLVDALGRDNHDVAVQLNNIAAIVARRGELEEAERLYSEALAIKERVLGPESSEIANTLNNLATVLRRRGKSDEAERAYRRAIRLLEGAVEPDHPSLQKARRNLAGLLRDRQAGSGRP